MDQKAFEKPARATVTRIPTRGGLEKFKPNDLAMCALTNHEIWSESTSGLLFEFNGKYWERISEQDVRAYVMAEDVHEYTTRSRRNEALSYIQDHRILREITWRQLKPYEIPLQNFIISIDKPFVGVQPTTRPHLLQDYLETIIPWDFDPTAQCPRWMEALDQYFGGDLDCDSKCSALQEFFGYTLMPHARYKKALVPHGDSDTGKSVIPWVIRQLVGSKNTCSVSVESMDDPRKREPLVGKMANILTELTSESVIADGGFKTLVSTEEPIQIDPKYMRSYNYVPIAKHIICTNTLPKINDRTQATFNRLLLIKFNKVLAAEEQDRSLQDKLILEMGGILMWALEGAARLYSNNGEFTKIAESRNAIKAYREAQNPVFLFVEEKCAREEGERVPSEWFRERFTAWYKQHVTPHKITILTKAAGLVVEDDPTWDADLRRTSRHVMGIRFLN